MLADVLVKRPNIKTCKKWAKDTKIHFSCQFQNVAYTVQQHMRYYIHKDYIPLDYKLHKLNTDHILWDNEISLQKYSSAFQLRLVLFHSQ